MTTKPLLLAYLTAALTWTAVGQRLVSVPSDRIVTLGERVVFTCTAEDSATVTWRKDGNPVHLSSNIKLDGTLVGSSVTGKLTILSMTNADEGSYECTAATVSGTQNQSKPFALEIAKPPVIRLPPSPFYGNESSAVVLVCEVTVAVPPPRIAFLRNGVEVAASTQNAMSFEWRISNVQRSAAGSYRCRATNMAGTDTQLVQLIVNYPPSVALSTGASIEFPVKESRTILCNTTGLPLARVWWTYGGSKVRAPVKSLSYEGSASLVLDELTMDNAGTYTCNAENFLGKGAGTVDVKLQGPPGPPDVPVLLRAARNSLHFRLSTPFDGNSPITAYKLHYSNTNGKNWTVVHVRASLADDFELDRLAGNTAYLTRAQAINQFGRSAYSSPSRAYETLPALPYPARSVKTSSTSTTIKLTWRVPELDADMGSLIGFKIRYYKTAQGKSAAQEKLVFADAVEYEIEELSRGTQYTVGVYAYSRAGDAPNTKEIMVNTTMSVPSSTFTLFEAFPLSSTRVDLGWSPPVDDGGSPILGYYISVRQKGKWEPLGNGRLTETVFQASGLEPGKKYRFQLIAENRIGNSSGALTETTTKEGAKPPVAQNFHEIQTTARTVTLGWTWQWPSSSSDKLFFRVSYRKNGETTWSRSGPFETRTKEYLLTGLDSETTYEMRLIAYNDEVEGDPSLSIAVRTNGQNDPVKARLSPPTLTTAYSTRAEFTWAPIGDASPGAVAYLFLYRVKGAQDWIPKRISDLTYSTYQLSDLKRNTTYEVTMVLEYGVKENGESDVGPQSTILVFTTTNVKTLSSNGEQMFIIIGAVCGVAVIICMVIVCLCCRARPGSKQNDDVMSVPGEWCPGTYAANGILQARTGSLAEIQRERPTVPPVTSFPQSIPMTMINSTATVTERCQIAGAVASPAPPAGVPSAVVAPFTPARAKTPSDHLPPYEPTEDTLRRQQNAPVVDPLPPTPSVQSYHSHREERPHLPSASSTTTDIAKQDIESQTSHIQSLEALDEYADELPPPPPPVTEDDDDGKKDNGKKDDVVVDGGGGTSNSARRPSMGSLPENDEENDADREMSPPPSISRQQQQQPQQQNGFPRPPSNHSNGSAHRAASPIGALPPSYGMPDMQSVGASSGRPMSTMSGNRPRHHRRRRNRSHSPGHHRSHRRRHQLLNGGPGGLPMKTLSPAASQHGSVGSWRPPPMSGTVEIAIDLPPPDLSAPPLTEHTIV